MYHHCHQFNPTSSRFHGRLARHGLLALLAATLAACGGGGSTSSGTPAGVPAGTPAIITGDTSASITRGDAFSVSGTLSVSDPDAGQAAFGTPGTLAGTFGSFSFSPASGVWSYQLNNASPALLRLQSGQSATDSLRVTSLDGTPKDITVTINGNSGIPLLTSATTPSYPSSDPFAAGKAAVVSRLNQDRIQCGFGAISQNTLLDKAAQGHADYLAANNLFEHSQIAGLPGFTGATVEDRLKGAGYDYKSFSETLAAMYKNTPTAHLKELYSSIYHLAALMSFNTEVGIGASTFTAPSGDQLTNVVIDEGTTLSWWGQQMPSNALGTFPCDGTSGLNPDFSPESPNPFPSIDMNVTPYGTPVFLGAAFGQSIKLTSGSITLRGGSAVPSVIMDKSNDPNARIPDYRAFLIPTTRLADNSTYDVVLSGTHSGMKSPSNPSGSFLRKFSFSTSTPYSN